MPPEFSPIRGAQGFAQSNPSVLSTVSLLGSLQIFEDAGGITKLRKRSIKLTRYLESLLRASEYFVEIRTDTGRTDASLAEPRFTIITPATPEDRGAQLSLFFLPVQIGVMQRIHDLLKRRGIIGDERQPDVIRLAPTPLYNTFEDCKTAAEGLNESFKELERAQFT